MSTAINITVDDGGLPARNRQQVAANRQAFVQNVTAEKSAALGVDQRSQDRIAQGRDPATGALLIPPISTGALGTSGGNIPRLNQQPAANRQLDKEETAFYFFKPDSGPDSNGIWQARGSGIVLPAELQTTDFPDSSANQGKIITYFTGSAVSVNISLLNSGGPSGPFNSRIGGIVEGIAARSLKPNVAAKKVIIEFSLKSGISGGGTAQAFSATSTTVTVGSVFQVFAIDAPDASYIQASLAGTQRFLPATPTSLTKVRAVVTRNSTQAVVYVDDNEDPIVFAVDPELTAQYLLASSLGVQIGIGSGVQRVNFGDPFPAISTGTPEAKDIRITWYL